MLLEVPAGTGRQLEKPDIRAALGLVKRDMPSRWLATRNLSATSQMDRLAIPGDPGGLDDPRLRQVKRKINFLAILFHRSRHPEARYLPRRMQCPFWTRAG